MNTILLFLSMIHFGWHFAPAPKINPATLECRDCRPLPITTFYGWAR